MDPGKSQHCFSRIADIRWGSNSLCRQAHSEVLSKSANGGSTWTEATPGLTERGNRLDGVEISSGAQWNVIGGTTLGKRNVISHNSDGVSIHENSTANNTIIGNYIGTDIQGTVPLGNGSYGVLVANGPQSNRVGGTTPAERNVISATGIGVGLSGSDTINNTIAGNYIGTDASGMAALGNLSGVMCDTRQNIIQGNVISSNEYDGIDCNGCNGSTMVGNYIGTDANGTGNLGNGSQGINLFNGAQHNVVGPGHHRVQS